MEFIDQILAMLGSIAAVLGVVISYLQYRANRERSRLLPPAGGPAGDPAGETVPPGFRPDRSRPRPTSPPAPVRIASVWVVVDSLVVVGLLFALFRAVVENRDGFGFVVPPLPEGVLWLAPVVLAGLVGLVAVPRAIRHAGGLRHGDPRMRGRLLGMAAVDLFLGVILAAVVLSLEACRSRCPTRCTRHWPGTSATGSCPAWSTSSC